MILKQNYHHLTLNLIRVGTFFSVIGLSVLFVGQVLIAGWLFYQAGKPNSAYAAGNSCVSNGTGNWNMAGTWTSCGGTVPDSADNVTILTGHVVTLDVAPTVVDLAINSGGTLDPSAANCSGSPCNLTVSGNLNLTGTWTQRANTVTMTGASKSLTTNGQTLYNITFSGTGTTTWNDSITAAGNVTLNNTISAAGTNLNMTGSGKDLVGGSATIGTLTINGNTTVKTSDLTVTDDFTVESGNTLTISGVTVSDPSTNGLSMTDETSTITGTGTLRFTNTSGGPGTSGVLSSVVRFDASAGNISGTTFPGRTYNGRVEIYSNSGTAKTASCNGNNDSYSLTGSTSHLYLIADGAGDLSMLCNTMEDAAFSIGGDLDFTGVGDGTESIIAGPNYWTVSGNVNFTGGTFDSTNNWFIMDGASKVLTAASNSFNHLTFSGSGTTTWNDNISATGDVNLISTISAGSTTLTMTGTGTLTTNGNTLNNFTTSGTGTITLANATHNIAGNLTLAAGATLAPGTSTVIMNGTNKTIDGGGKTLANLTISNTSGTVTLQNTDLTVSTLLTVSGSGGSLTLNSGRTLTQPNNADLALTGTITGDGVYYGTPNDAHKFPNTGTITSNITLDVVSCHFELPERSYSAIGRTTKFLISADSCDGGEAVLGTDTDQTLTFAGNMVIENTADIYDAVMVRGDSYNPNVVVGGSVSGVAGAYFRALRMGSGTWIVGGNFDLTNIPNFDHGSGALTMNGASKALTTNGKTLNNLTFSGTGTTTWNDSISAAGNVTLNSTISAGSTTLTMTGSGKDLVGGSATIKSLTLSGSTTLKTSNLTLAGTLTVAANTTLTITGVTLTDSGTAQVSWGNGSSTITGTGTLRFTDASGGPGSGGVISSVSRFDATNGNISGGTFKERIYGGRVELYSNSDTARTVSWGNVGAQYTLSGSSSHLYLIADGAGNLSFLSAGISDSGFTIGGDLDFTGVGAGAESITPGGNYWEVSGNVDFTGGTFITADNTLAMNGTGTITTDGNTLNNFTASGVVTIKNTDLTVSSLLTVDNGKQLNIDAGRTLILSGTSGTTLALNGTVAGAGRLTYNSTTAFPSTGTITSILRMNASNATLAIPTRTIGGQLEVYSNSNSADRTVTYYGGTIQSNLYLYADGTKNVTFDAYTMTVNGDVDFLGTGSGSEALYEEGFEYWTLAGNVDLTGGSYEGGLLTEIDLTGSGSKTISGAFSPYFLVIDSSTNDPITLTNAAISVMTLLTVTASDSLIVSGGSTVTPVNLALSGTISGEGLVIFTDSALGPGTGGTLSANVRYDATNGNVSSSTFAARTYGGAVELYSNSGSARSITAAAGSYTFSSTLTSTAGGVGVLTANFSAATGTTTIVSDLNIGATSSFTAPASLSVGGSFTNAGTYSHNSGTLTMAGTGTLTAASSALNNLIATGPNTLTIGGSTNMNNFTVSGIGTAKTITFTAGTTQTVSGTWTITGAAKQLITLQSSSTSPWNVNATTAEVGYANISYSTNLGSTIDADFSTDLGHNTNWRISTTSDYIIGFTSTNGAGNESIASITIPLSLTFTQSEDTTVNYAVTGGTATGGGVDYALASGTATIVAGNTSTTISVTVINDSQYEPDETIIVTISNPVDATLGTNTVYTYTILNDDIQTHTLTYTAGPNGTLTGTTSQIVDHGAHGSAVTAIPATGFHFVAWSDASTANPRTDTNVISDLAVSASFGADTIVTSPIAPSGYLKLTVTSPKNIKQGAKVTYTITVKNTGLASVSNMKISFTIPKFTKMTTKSASTVLSPTWTCKPKTSAGSVCTVTTSSLAVGAVTKVYAKLTIVSFVTGLNPQLKLTVMATSGTLAAKYPTTKVISRLHTVQRGQTLVSLSKLYYGTTKLWRKIRMANKKLIRANSSSIYPGWKMVIP